MLAYIHVSLVMYEYIHLLCFISIFAKQQPQSHTHTSLNNHHDHISPIRLNSSEVSQRHRAVFLPAC